MRVTTIAVACLLAFGCSSSDSDSKGSDAAADAGNDGEIQKDSTKPDPDSNDGKTDATQDSSEPSTLACGAVTNCWGCCPSEDDDCRIACEEAMSVDGKKAWVALNDCVSSSCTTECEGGEQQCNDCVDAKCGDQRKACTWGPAGSGKCMDGYACFTECPTMVIDGSGTAETCPTNPGLVCVQKCLTLVTAESEKLLQAVGYCVYTKCADTCLVEGKETECNTCRESECLAEYTACKNDK